MRVRLLTLGSVLLGALASAAQASSFVKLWNDGRAEVAVYDSEAVINGKPRTFREHLIVTHEQLRADTLTKADNANGQDVIDVLALFQVKHVDLDNFPRSMLTTVFVKSDDAQQVVKATLGLQDWTGNTFKLLKTSPDGTESTLLVYGPAESEQPTELAFGKNAYIEEQLPLSLRVLPFKDGFGQQIKLWDVLTNGVPAGLYPQGMPATLTISGPEDVRSRAGTLPCWLVTIKKATGSDSYWFEKADPHLLVKMATADGRKRLLIGRARWSFWDKRIPRPSVLN